MKSANIFLFNVVAACSSATPVDGEEAARRAEVAIRERTIEMGFSAPRQLNHDVKVQGEYWLVEFWDSASSTTGGGGVVWVNRKSGKVETVLLGQ